MRSTWSISNDSNRQPIPPRSRLRSGPEDHFEKCRDLYIRNNLFRIDVQRITMTPSRPAARARAVCTPMPRHGKGARLWLRPARLKDGRIIANAVWIIRDGGRDFATGCIAHSTGKAPPPEAERALANYIASKYRPQRTQRVNSKIFALQSTITPREPACRHRSYYPSAKVKLSDPVVDLFRVARLLWACWRYREIETVHTGARRGKPHAAPHGSDLAHATRRRFVGSGWILGHVRRDARAQLWPPSSRSSAARRARDRLCEARQNDFCG
jgi:hypothetical protein